MTPDLNGIPRQWRLRAQRYRLTGCRCPECGIVAFPPRPVCLPCTGKAEWSFHYQFTVIDPSPFLHQPIQKEKRTLIA